jgi:hypothetical protein
VTRIAGASGRRSAERSGGGSPAGSSAFGTKARGTSTFDDANQLADDWRQAGIEFVGPEDFDDGKREGSHVDPDGNLIRFGSPPLRR